MKYIIRCQIQDEKFDPDIVGTLVNPRQFFEVIIATTESKACEFIRVIPVYSIEILWTDVLGDLHTSYYSRSSSFLVDKKFLETYE